MDETEAPQSLPIAWSRVALRHPEGDFLAAGSGISLYRCATPYGAMSWETGEALTGWIVNRPAYIRRRLAEEGWWPVTLEVRCRPLQSDPETRPAVVEMAGHQ